MNDIFANQYIDLTLYYTIKKNKYGVNTVNIVPEEEAHKLLADETKKATVKSISTKWVQQSWRAAQDLMSKSMLYDHTSGESKFNAMMYRDARIKTCLVDWNVKDEDGTPMSCNEQTISSLNWEVAQGLLNLYESALMPDEDKEQNAKN